MATTTGSLTEVEQQGLQQMRQAQESGSTLKDCAAKLGLDVRKAVRAQKAPGSQGSRFTASPNFHYPPRFSHLYRARAPRHTHEAPRRPEESALP